MTAPVASQRILRGTAAAITTQLLDQDGEPTNAVGAVTVDVTRADGSLIAAGAATTNSGNPAIYSYALAAGTNDRLDLLRLDWRDSGTVRMTTYCDVVGGFYFTVAEVRAFDTRIDANLASDAKVRAVRREVEDSCERITGTAWVPRYRRINILPAETRGRGWNVMPLNLDVWAPRTIRSARVYIDGDTYTALSGTELADVVLREWGTAERADTSAWLNTAGGTILEVEYGYDRPTSELRHAAMTHARALCYRETTGIPDRATSFQLTEGGYFQIATPGVGPFQVGIPDVDAVYQRHRVARDVGIA